jgi:hypothetical protein
LEKKGDINFQRCAFDEEIKRNEMKFMTFCNFLFSSQKLLHKFTQKFIASKCKGCEIYDCRKLSQNCVVT